MGRGVLLLFGGFFPASFWCFLVFFVAFSRGVSYFLCVGVLFFVGVVVGRSFAVVGSRSLVGSAALVGRVCSSLVRSGASLSVGCALGLDSSVLSWAVGSGLVSSVRCFSAFGAGGVGGSSSVSAFSSVASFVALGGSVSWWSGGSSSVPFVGRLASRSRAVVASVSSGVVAFFSSPSSRGSALACSFAVSRGLPVVAFAVGFSPSLLPSLGCGSWVASGRGGVWASAWVWRPSVVPLSFL